MVRKAGTTRASSYDTRNHCNILFQCYGSVFPRVISFCITNVIIMIAVKQISDRYGEYSSGLKISNVGHSFISLIVSFLLVSRVNTSLGRYNEARAYLGQMYRETRKFHVACLLVECLSLSVYSFHCALRICEVCSSFIAFFPFMHPRKQTIYR